MLDIDVEDKLVLKVGGKLKLTSLIQKRMIELKRGARSLVPRDRKSTLIELIVEEILQDKIHLAPRSECDTTFLDNVRRVRRVDDDGSAAPTGSEIYGSDLKRIKEQRIKELSALLGPGKK
ncbi:MAG: hypothetical protein ACKVX7_04325 [Planctomycetota bacterium]